MIPQWHNISNYMRGRRKSKEKMSGSRAMVKGKWPYLDSLKEVSKRMVKTSNDFDRLFLLSLLPAMKQLSPLDNMDFRVEVQETLQRKLRHHAAREVELRTYPSTSSVSPALSQYSGNSHISLVDYTSASEGYQRNATNPVTVVQQTGSSMYVGCPENKFRLRILLLQHCSHNGAHAC
jgi:hypothetical protein